MARIEVAPLRPWTDFFPGSDRFAKPDTKDFTKWNNRVVSNLLYYQTNYLALVTFVFLLVGVNGRSTLVAIVVVSVVFVVSVWVGENGAAINNFKKQKPSAFIILIMVASCILISVLGSIVVFMWAITLPLILIFAHASFRKRNMKNKLGFGLKKTFMGILLDSLGQQEETVQKLNNFLD
uniref:PRA1 family protein n=1 Tax=Oreochromis niloticus TaxID=8128 RepID=A0A669B3W2_ORENI